MKKEFRIYTIMYHRVSDNKSDSITVSAKEFEKQIRFFKNNYLCPDPRQLISDFKTKRYEKISILVRRSGAEASGNAPYSCSGFSLKKVRISFRIRSKIKNSVHLGTVFDY